GAGLSLGTAGDPCGEGSVARLRRQDEPGREPESVHGTHSREASVEQPAGDLFEGEGVALVRVHQHVDGKNQRRQRRGTVGVDQDLGDRHRPSWRERIEGLFEQQAAARFALAVQNMPAVAMACPLPKFASSKSPATKPNRSATPKRAVPLCVIGITPGQSTAVTRTCGDRSASATLHTPDPAAKSSTDKGAAAFDTSSASLSR